MESRYLLGRSPGKITLKKNYISGKKMETYSTGGHCSPPENSILFTDDKTHTP